MKYVLTALVFLLAIAETAGAQTHVDGYTRRDGTYVAPHYRSSPNNSYNDNWSTRGNVNPYTGREGTRGPTFNDRSPSYNQRNFGTSGEIGGGSGFNSPYRDTLGGGGSYGRTDSLGGGYRR
jgi:hypothetical protein